MVGISIRFTQRSSVDLPAPLGPITMTISPWVTVDIDAIHHGDIAEHLRQAVDGSSGAARSCQPLLDVFREPRTSTEIMTR